MRTISFTLNGARRTVSVDERRRLLWVLRTDLALTGTKYGCGRGLCGACTVVVDGRAVRSCATGISSVDGHTVTTVEGLADGGQLHPLQAAFVDHEAFQCGFCTPGMLMAACALIGRTPHPTRAQAIEALDRNLCRCGAHTRILAAIADLAARSDPS